MSKFKVGDKVRNVSDFDGDLKIGKVYEITTDSDTYGSSELRSEAAVFVGDNGNSRRRDGRNYELIEPAAPKGTFERLMIESLPQGGYKVTASGPTYAHTHNELAAFTTLKEATEFVGRNMR